MNESNNNPEVGHVYLAINQIMNNIAVPKRDAPNADNRGSVRYQYQRWDDLVATLNRLMVENRLVCIPSCHLVAHEQTGTLTEKGNPWWGAVLNVTVTVQSAVDGSTVAVQTIGEGMDTGDKSVQKAFTSGMKYALLKLFLVPDADDPDGAPGPGPSDSTPGAADNTRLPMAQATSLASKKKAVASLLTVAYKTKQKAGVIYRSLEPLFSTPEACCDWLIAVSREAREPLTTAVESKMSEAAVPGTDPGHDGKEGGA